MPTQKGSTSLGERNGRHTGICPQNTLPGFREVCVCGQRNGQQAKKKLSLTGGEESSRIDPLNFFALPRCSPLQT
jgi:hypothetical protein